MKISFKPYLLLLACIFTVLTVSAQWQDKLFTASYQNENMVRVLRDISSFSKIDFAYDAGLLRQIKVTIDFVNVPLKQVLNDLLHPHQLDWKAIGETVIVVPMEVEDPLVEPQVTAFALNGTVIDDASGETLPFAQLRIELTSEATSTDAYGKFYFRSIPSDTCVLLVDYVGYTRLRMRVSKLGPSPVIVSLQAARTFLPSAVVVDQIAPEMESAPERGVQSMNPAALGVTASMGEADPLKAAQLLPGVIGTSENSGGLNIRGSDADQSLIVYDGFTLYHLDHMFGLFSSLNSNAVKNIRVHKGPIPASFGGRIGGVLEATGKDGNNQQLHGKFDAGPLAIGVQMDAPLNKSKTSTALFAFRRSFTDIVKSAAYRQLFNNVYNAGIRVSNASPQNSFESTESPVYAFQDMTAKFTFRKGQRHVFQVSTYLSDDRIQFGYADATDGYRYRVRTENSSLWGNVGGAVKWVANPTPESKWVNSIGFSRYRSRFFSTDTITDGFFNQDISESSNDQLVLRDVNIRSEWSKLKVLQVGIQLNGMNIRHYLFQSSTDASDEDRLSDETQNAWVISPYANKTLQNRRSILDIGTRVNYYTLTQKTYPEWRLNGFTELSENWSLNASISRIHQFVHRIYPQSIFNTTSDLWWLSDGDRLPVLRSDQITVGLVFKKRRWQFEASAYSKSNKGTFEYLGPYSNALRISDKGLSIVSGNGKIIGADVLLQYHYGHINTWCSYSWLNTHNKFASLEQEWVPETYDQRHEVKWYGEYEWRQWEVSTTLLFGTGKPYTRYLGTYELPLADGSSKWIPTYGALNGSRLPNYFRADFVIGRKFQWNTYQLKLQFALLNATNHKNIRDIRYVANVIDGSLTNITQRNISMLGRMPTLQLQFEF